MQFIVSFKFIYKYWNQGHTKLLQQKSEKTNESFLRKMLNCWRYKDIFNLKILESEWPRAFWAISQELKFSQI